MAMNFSSGKSVNLDFDSVGCNMEKLANLLAAAVGPFSSNQVEMYLARTSAFGGAEALHDSIASSKSPRDWVTSATVWPNGDPGFGEGPQPASMTLPQKFSFLPVLCCAKCTKGKQWVVGSTALRVALVQTGDVLICSDQDLWADSPEERPAPFQIAGGWASN
jgi:hypothetical protein